QPGLGQQPPGARRGAVPAGGDPRKRAAPARARTGAQGHQPAHQRTPAPAAAGRGGRSGCGAGAAIVLQHDGIPAHRFPGGAAVAIAAGRHGTRPRGGRMKRAWGLRSKVLLASLCLIGVLMLALALLLVLERQSRSDVLSLSAESQSRLTDGVARAHAIAVV